MKSIYKEVADKLLAWSKTYNEYVSKCIELNKSIEDESIHDEKLNQLKEEYKGFTSIFDFKESCELKHVELSYEPPEVRKTLSIPDYFWSLRKEIGKSCIYGKVTGFIWFIDDICYIIDHNGYKTYIPINMRIEDLDD